MIAPRKIYGMNLHIENGTGDFIPLRPIDPPMKIKPLDVKLDFKCDMSAEAIESLGSFFSEHAKVHAERLQAETDRWCWKAIAQGVGNRVWRSNPILHEDTFVTTYQFAILKPDEAAPGPGVVIGPFSKP